MTGEKFLLDANTFITPYENYYPFDFAPGFWRQLLPKLSRSNVAVLDTVRSEVLKGNDELSQWLKEAGEINICSRKDSGIIAEYAKVLTYIQESNLYTDRALREWSGADVADPWLIAAAVKYGYTIITFEKSLGKITSPSSKPKIPDIAKQFGVKTENLYYFMRELKFRL